LELKRDEIIGDRKLHNDELHNFHSSPNIIKMMKLKRWAGHVTYMGAECIQSFGGKTKRKETTRRTDI
jgi:hypothetical protein